MAGMDEASADAAAPAALADNFWVCMMPLYQALGSNGQLDG